MIKKKPKIFILKINDQTYTCAYAKSYERKYLRNNTDSAELVTNYESSLSLADILPVRSKDYDKNRAPKLLGQPTIVYFHVTVLSLDSINEESMVSNLSYTKTTKTH